MRLILCLHYSLLLSASFYSQIFIFFFNKLTSNSNANNKYQSSCGIKAKTPWATASIKQCFCISTTMIAKFIQHLSKKRSALSLPLSTECNFGGFLRVSLEVTHLSRKIPWKQQSPLYFTWWFVTKALSKSSFRRDRGNPAPVAVSFL